MAFLVCMLVLCALLGATIAMLLHDDNERNDPPK